MRTKSILTVIAICFVAILFAQEPSLNYPEINEKCGTVHMQEWRQQNLRNVESDAEFEEWLSRKIQEMDFSNRMVITVPVVVHVIHSGQAVGTAPNINDAQVLSQIDVLNEDFRRISGTNGFNNHPDGADVEIEFCMASIDPSGSPTNGINRQDLGVNGWGSGTADATMKPSTIWDPEQYFNIWVCELSAGLLGYAQFPTGSGLQGLNGGAANTDGVVIGHQYFGTSEQDDGTFILSNTYDLGRTLTHEAGHFFGLRHIWGDGGCTASDYCDDTPESDASNGDCQPHVSCGTQDMIENYMDYSVDYCMNIFTNDQKTRMLTVMANSPRRANLANSTVCTLPPSFAFTGQVVDAQTQQGIVGAKVKFSGAFSPEATTGANGMFTIPTLYDGNYEVLAGEWGYMTKSTASQYFDANSNAMVVELERGYYDDFVLDLGWSVSGDAETGQWVKGSPVGSDFDGVLYDPSSDVTGDFGDECYLTGNSGGGAGVNDVDNGTAILTSPVFDGTLYNNPKVSLQRWFMTGGGGGATPDDIFEISLSNGSQTVVVETVDINSSDLGQWVAKEFVVSDYLSVTNNMRLIVSTSDQVTSSEGHLVDAAIDLFRVDEANGTAVDNTLASELGFTLSPNPSNGNFNINLENLDGNAQVSIFDALGRRISFQEVNSGISNINITNQSTGIYFLQVTVGDRSFVRKVIKN